MIPPPSGSGVSTESDPDEFSPATLFLPKRRFQATEHSRITAKHSGSRGPYQIRPPKPPLPANRAGYRVPSRRGGVGVRVRGKAGVGVRAVTRERDHEDGALSGSSEVQHLQHLYHLQSRPGYPTLLHRRTPRPIRCHHALPTQHPPLPSETGEGGRGMRADVGVGFAMRARIRISVLISDQPSSTAIFLRFPVPRKFRKFRKFTAHEPLHSALDTERLRLQ